MDCRRMYCAIIYICICIMSVVWCIQFCDQCFAWEHIEVKCETCRYLDCRNSMKLLVVQCVCSKYGTLFCSVVLHHMDLCSHVLARNTVERGLLSLKSYVDIYGCNMFRHNCGT